MQQAKGTITIKQKELVLNQVKLPRTNKNRVVFSSEQKLFIDKAKAGHDILVEDCIGSGKQQRFNAFVPFGKLL